MRGRRPPPISQTITQIPELSKKIPEAPKIESKIINQPDSTAPVQLVTNFNDDVTHKIPIIKDIPFYPDPNNRPPSKPIRTPMPGSSQRLEEQILLQKLILTSGKILNFKKF